MDVKTEKAMFQSLVMAERTIALLNSMVLSGEKHSSESEKIVKSALSDIRCMKYIFID